MRRRTSTRTHCSVLGCVMCALVAVPSALACTPAQESGPDLILTGGAIYPAGSPAGRVSAIALAGDVIASIGDDTSIRGLAGDATQEMALEDRAALPGFHDDWIDLEAVGRWNEGLDLREAVTLREVAARVRQAAASSAPGAGIVGFGWDETTWPDTTLPSADPLDAAYDGGPVVLFRRDGPVAWLNSRALEVAGINGSTAAPPGGSIGRGPDGEPDGLLLGTAVRLVEQVVSAPSGIDRRRWMEAGLHSAVAMGVTSVATVPLDREMVEILRGMANAGDLSIRVALRFDTTAVDSIDPRSFDSAELLRAEAIALRLDGPFRPRMAALEVPFLGSEDRGQFLVRNQAIETAVKAANRHGLELHIHARGDRAVARALAAIARVDAGGRVIGADLPARDLLESEVPGIVTAIPHRMAHDLYWLDTVLGSERAETMHPLRTFVERGVLGSFASDAPAYPLFPMAAAWTAIRRRDLEGYPLDGWHYSQAIDVGSALQALVGSGRAGRRASLAAGNPADLVVWSEDPFGEDPDFLLRAQALVVIVAGRVVYSRPLVELPMSMEQET